MVGRWFPLDKCARERELVRRKERDASAFRPFRLLFDFFPEGDFAGQIEKKRGKARRKTALQPPFFHLADADFPECGQNRAFLRQNVRVYAHKKSVYSALTRAFVRKEFRIFAGKHLNSANKRENMYRASFYLGRTSGSPRWQEMGFPVFLT